MNSATHLQTILVDSPVGFTLPAIALSPLQSCDRTSQSPQLVVGGWCGTKYGLAIATTASTLVTTAYSYAIALLLL